MLSGYSLLKHTASLPPSLPLFFPSSLLILSLKEQVQSLPLLSSSDTSKFIHLFRYLPKISSRFFKNVFIQYVLNVVLIP